MTSHSGSDPLAAEVVGALSSRGWTLAMAESLTAGLLSARIAAVPGASAVLRGGLVVYATDLKSSLAGVPKSVLRINGAVSPETARALADGAVSRCHADVGVGLTGVAGPDQQEGHPVGTVHIGVRFPGRPTRHALVHLSGNRAAIREQACTRALRLVLSEVDPEAGNESGS